MQCLSISERQLLRAHRTGCRGDPECQPEVVGTQLNVTSVIVAHRLSTITGCNRIIVMDKGRIAEEGSSTELMAKNGIFAGLAKRQLA